MPADTSRCTRYCGRSVKSGLTCFSWEQVAYPTGPPQPLLYVRALTEYG
jgi:hypothetical protein